MKNNPQWKKLLALVLCIVQCMVLAVPAVSAEEIISDAEPMEVTSFVCDVPLSVTMKEEDTYWWGQAFHSRCHHSCVHLSLVDLWHLNVLTSVKSCDKIRKKEFFL